jgi:hypothetical protein
MGKSGRLKVTRTGTSSFKIAGNVGRLRVIGKSAVTVMDKIVTGKLGKF